MCIYIISDTSPNSAETARSLLLVVNYELLKQKKLRRHDVEYCEETTTYVDQWSMTTKLL